MSEASWIEEFFAPPGPAVNNAATGTMNDVTTTESGARRRNHRYTGAAPTITGFASGKPGRPITLFAVGGPIVLRNENAGSLAANRITTGTGGDVTVPQGGAAELVYDEQSSRWRLVGGTIAANAFVPPAQVIAALNIDWSLSSVFTKDLAAGSSTFTFSNATSGHVISVRLKGHASGSTVTWPTVKWMGGSPPVQTPTGRDVYTFIHDGTDIYGSVIPDAS